MRHHRPQGLPAVGDLVLAAWRQFAVGPVLTLTASGGAGREELLTIDQVTGSEGTGPLGNPNP